MADQFIKVLYLDQTQSIETWICESNNAKYQSVIYSHPVFKNSSRFDIETFNKYWGGNNSVARVEGNTIKVMLRLHQPWLSANVRLPGPGGVANRLSSWPIRLRSSLEVSSVDGKI